MGNGPNCANTFETVHRGSALRTFGEDSWSDAQCCRPKGLVAMIRMKRKPQMLVPTMLMIEVAKQTRRPDTGPEERTT